MKVNRVLILGQNTIQDKAEISTKAKQKKTLFIRGCGWWFLRCVHV